MNPVVTLGEARAMVSQFHQFGSEAQREAVAIYVTATRHCVAHAVWELYGRVKGLPCLCSACLADPPIGSEFVLRVLAYKTMRCPDKGCGVHTGGGYCPEHGGASWSNEETHEGEARS